MKALISPEEVSVISYVSAWVDGEPQYTEIEDCQRVAEVAEDPFEVHSSLFWVDCPDDCSPLNWYYKDGLHKFPEDAPKPVEPTEE